jgi:hypothetical protein
MTRAQRTAPKKQASSVHRPGSVNRPQWSPTSQIWRYPSAALADVGIARLPVWLTAGPEPGHLAVVTETGPAASITESVRRIWAGIARETGLTSCCLSTTPARRRARRADT